MQTRRKVVLITTAFAEDWLVIRALTEAHDVYIVRPVDKEIGAHSKWARYRIARTQQYVHLHCSGSLAPPRLEGVGIPFVDVKARKINTTETQTLIEAQHPDFLVACGAPILKKNIFRIPRVAAVNIHWGIAPALRGAESTFWALLKNQWDSIGITIHKIDDGVDTGAHLAQGTPRLEPTDTEGSLWVKNSRLAAQLILDVLAAADEAIRSGGQQPAGNGEYYRYRDHRWWHDVQLWLRGWSRRYRPPHRAPREAHYYGGQIRE